MSAGATTDPEVVMHTFLLLLSPFVQAAPAVADLQPTDRDTVDFVVEGIQTPPQAEAYPEVEMAGAVVRGTVPGGPRVRGYGGRIELEASMGADGASASDADLVWAQTAPAELTTTATGRTRRDEAAVTGWVGLTDGETRLARRAALGAGTVCAEREGSPEPEHDLDLRLTRPPPAGEALAQQTWEARPSFVLGEDSEGQTGVYASLQPGDQITVVQISGGPRFVEEVELERTGRTLRWRRDHKGESVCYEDPPAE